MPTPVATLFDPFRAGTLMLKNRIVMASLRRNRAPQAIPSELMAEYYAQRASAGLLITEGIAISPQAQGYADAPGLYQMEQLDGWKRVTRSVHEAGGQIMALLWHVGRVSNMALQPDMQPPVAPSAITARADTMLFIRGLLTRVPTSPPRALDSEELPGIVHSFQVAARNAVESVGFDGVEIHGGSGYLLDQFLKRSANHRHDDYGGSIENRARLLLEVVRAVAVAVGSGRTGVRLSPVTPSNDAYDADPQPLFDYVLRQLAVLNLAYIHMVQGAVTGRTVAPLRPFDDALLVDAYREAGGRGGWMVNNDLGVAKAEICLANGIDLMAFGRSYVANPDLVERLRRNGPFRVADSATFYGGDAKGYTDYPQLAPNFESSD